MVHLGYSDLIQMVVIGIGGGAYSLAHSTDPYWLMYILGAFGNCAWFANNCLAHLLAFNRFVLVRLWKTVKARV